MNVSDLIDYLSQIDNPQGTEVVIDDDDFDGEGDYLSLRFVFADWRPYQANPTTIPTLPAEEN